MQTALFAMLAAPSLALVAQFQVPHSLTRGQWQCVFSVLDYGRTNLHALANMLQTTTAKIQSAYADRETALKHDQSAALIRRALELGPMEYNALIPLPLIASQPLLLSAADARTLPRPDIVELSISSRLSSGGRMTVKMLLSQAHDPDLILLHLKSGMISHWIYTVVKEANLGQIANGPAAALHCVFGGKHTLSLVFLPPVAELLHSRSSVSIVNSWLTSQGLAVDLRNASQLQNGFEASQTTAGETASLRSSRPRSLDSSSGQSDEFMSESESFERSQTSISYSNSNMGSYRRRYDHDRSISSTLRTAGTVQASQRSPESSLSNSSVSMSSSFELQSSSSTWPQMNRLQIEPQGISRQAETPSALRYALEIGARRDGQPTSELTRSQSFGVSQASRSRESLGIHSQSESSMTPRSRNIPIDSGSARSLHRIDRDDPLLAQSYPPSSVGASGANASNRTTGRSSLQIERTGLDLVFSQTARHQYSTFNGISPHSTPPAIQPSASTHFESLPVNVSPGSSPLENTAHSILMSALGNSPPSGHGRLMRYLRRRRGSGGRRSTLESVSETDAAILQVRIEDAFVDNFAEASRSPIDNIWGGGDMPTSHMLQLFSGLSDSSGNSTPMTPVMDGGIQESQLSPQSNTSSPQSHPYESSFTPSRPIPIPNLALRNTRNMDRFSPPMSPALLQVSTDFISTVRLDAQRVRGFGMPNIAMRREASPVNLDSFGPDSIDSSSQSSTSNTVRSEESSGYSRRHGDRSPSVLSIATPTNLLGTTPSINESQRRVPLQGALGSTAGSSLSHFSSTPISRADSASRMPGCRNAFPQQSDAISIRKTKSMSGYNRASFNIIAHTDPVLYAVDVLLEVAGTESLQIMRALAIERNQAALEHVAKMLLKRGITIQEYETAVSMLVEAVISSAAINDPAPHTRALWESKAVLVVLRTRPSSSDCPLQDVQAVKARVLDAFLQRVTYSGTPRIALAAVLSEAAQQRIVSELASGPLSAPMEKAIERGILPPYFDKSAMRQRVAAWRSHIGSAGRLVADTDLISNNNAVFAISSLLHGRHNVQAVYDNTPLPIPGVPHSHLAVPVALNLRDSRMGIVHTNDLGVVLRETIIWLLTHTLMLKPSPDEDVRSEPLKTFLGIFDFCTGKRAKPSCTQRSARLSGSLMVSNWSDINTMWSNHKDSAAIARLASSLIALSVAFYGEERLGLSNYAWEQIYTCESDIVVQGQRFLLEERNPKRIPTIMAQQLMRWHFFDYFPRPSMIFAIRRHYKAAEIW